MRPYWKCPHCQGVQEKTDLIKIVEDAKRENANVYSLSKSRELPCRFCGQAVDIQELVDGRFDDDGISNSPAPQAATPTPDFDRSNPDYVLGTSFQAEGDYAKASSYFRKAAEEGCAAAQHDLGVLYIQSQNYSEAAKWFRKAAEQGVADSQANLGLHYARGIGVTKDSAEAVKWFRKAAEQGFPDGIFKLGAMYANGEGVPQDFKEALRLIGMAADMGHPEARVERELVARRAFFAGALD